MKTISSLMILGLGMSGASYAGVRSGTALTLQDLKTKCVELTANEQLKPFKAKVTCSQVSNQWRRSAAAADPLKLENSNEIGATFNLKSFTVPAQAELVPLPATEIECQVWEQYKITTSAVDMELDCAALEAVENIAALCTPAIEERVKADPSVQVEEATGQKYNTCAPAGG